MKIAFMGTPAFAVPALNALVNAGHEVPAVYTQPPRPAGRGKAPRLSPVHQRAEALGLAVRTPGNLRSVEAQAEFAALDLDAAVVAAYGLILPQPILDAPRHGCINIHASLLPRWRGAAPIQRAILAGDSETGVTIMQMEAGLDTGPMLDIATMLVDRKNAGQLFDELAELGAGRMLRVLEQPDRWAPVSQPAEGVTYAAKIMKTEARLDFALDAAQVERTVRAFSPAPGAFFEVLGERLKILAGDTVALSGDPGTVLDDRLTIACGTGAIRPLIVQRQGKAAMETGALLRGWTIPPGTRVS